MTKIDYMKMISILSRTLKMETIDVQFIDKSVDRLEITLGGSAKQERKVALTLSDFSAFLSFPKDFLSAKEFDKWRSIFEYELEQAYLKNVDLQVEKDVSRYILKMKL